MIRKGIGCHALTVIRQLISLGENWFPIANSDDYNFPGVFDFPYPQRLGYCEDISKLQNFEKSDPHFIFSDIQLGKWKARPKRVITLDVDGKAETIMLLYCPLWRSQIVWQVRRRLSLCCPNICNKALLQAPRNPITTFWRMSSGVYLHLACG